MDSETDRPETAPPAVCYETHSDTVQLRRHVKKHIANEEFVSGLRALDRLIELNQATADDWKETGKALSAIGEFAQALGAFENCLGLNPEDDEARHDLGRSLYKLGDTDLAVSLIAQVADKTELLPVRMGLATIAPGSPALGHDRVLDVRRRFANALRNVEAPLPRQPHPRRASQSKVRVGYLSAHFHKANYMKPVWPLINAHAEQFDITLFDDAASDQRSFDWLQRPAVIEPVEKQSNAELAETIRSLEIDILVDLSAYSKPERLGVYLHRPARMQIAWFNMYATSGFEEMDIIVGDSVVVKPNEEPFYTESVRRLPVSYLTFQTNHEAPDVTLRPGGSGGEFVFGCFSTQYKITPPVLNAWATILTQAKNARMVLANHELKSRCNREFLLSRFAQLGIEPERIEFLPPVDHFNFLKYYDRIDIALDTFPYSGGTTTMEALWQGVPVVTFDGDRWASRTSASLLAHSPVPQFVGRDVNDYCRIAVKFAVDRRCRNELLEIRRSMRQKLSASSVCDSASLATSMDSLFRQIISLS